MVLRASKSLQIGWDEIQSQSVPAKHQRSPSFEYSSKLKKMLSLGDFVEVSLRETETANEMLVSSFGIIEWISLSLRCV